MDEFPGPNAQRVSVVSHAVLHTQKLHREQPSCSLHTHTTAHKATVGGMGVFTDLVVAIIS